MQAFVIIPNDYTQDQMDALDQAIETAGLSRARLDRRHIAPDLAYRLNSHQPGGDTVVIVKLDPEYLEVVVAYMHDGDYEVMGTPERAEVRYNDGAANRPVLEYLVDKHLSRAKGANATGLLDKTQQQHAFERQGGNHDDKLLRRAMLFNNPTAMKRLYNEIFEANAIFLQPSPSHSKTLVRIETQSFFESHDFSEDLTLSQWQDLRRSTLTAFLSIVEQTLEYLSEYDTCFDVVVVTGASSLVPDAIRLLKSYFRGRGREGEEVRFPTGIDPALATLQGMAVIVENYFNPAYEF